MSCSVFVKKNLMLGLSGNSDAHGGLETVGNEERTKEILESLLEGGSVIDGSREL